MAKTEVDQVVLVGGSTRIPKVGTEEGLGRVLLIIGRGMYLCFFVDGCMCVSQRGKAKKYELGDAAPDSQAGVSPSPPATRAEWRCLSI